MHSETPRRSVWKSPHWTNDVCFFRLRVPEVRLRMERERAAQMGDSDAPRAKNDDFRLIRLTHPFRTGPGTPGACLRADMETLIL